MIKELIEKNYIIVLDTNVLLNVYRFSPEVSDFNLECLNTIKEAIFLPATVSLEYDKHYRAEFSKMEKKVAEAGKETKKQIEAAKNKITKSCDIMERLQFPDIDDLREALSDKIDEVKDALEKYYEDHASLSFIQHSWGKKDRLLCLVNYIRNCGNVMDSPTQEDIYRWCEDGEKRYQKEIPPGFKDAKCKDGVRKYSDLILWNETLRFAKTHKKNVIFVTDDVKADWWETENDNHKFHSKLVEEFGKTGQILVPMTLQDFYNAIADSYGVLKTDAVEIALRMTDEDFCYKVSDDVFEKVEEYLMYNSIKFIDEDTAHIGSEGIEEFEISEYKYIGAERIDRNDCIVEYNFIYDLTLRGTSYEYWGKEPDTKEVIRSDGRDHIFKGEIVVCVERKAEVFIDFEDDDSFENAVVVYGELRETDYNDRPDPLDRMGEFGICPDCGRPLTIENDGGNGFCIHCAPNH